MYKRQVGSPLLHMINGIAFLMMLRRHGIFSVKMRKQLSLNANRHNQLHVQTTVGLLTKLKLVILFHALMVLLTLLLMMQIVSLLISMIFVGGAMSQTTMMVQMFPLNLRMPLPLLQIMTRLQSFLMSLNATNHCLLAILSACCLLLPTKRVFL